MTVKGLDYQKSAERWGRYGDDYHREARAYYAESNKTALAIGTFLLGFIGIFVEVGVAGGGSSCGVLLLGFGFIFLITSVILSLLVFRGMNEFLNRGGDYYEQLSKNLNLWMLRNNKDRGTEYPKEIYKGLKLEIQADNKFSYAQWVFLVIGFLCVVLYFSLHLNWVQAASQVISWIATSKTAVKVILTMSVMILSIFPIQYFVKGIAIFLNNRLKESISRLLGKVPTKPGSKARRDLKNEVDNFKILSAARGEFLFVTRAIGVMEILLFAPLTALVRWENLLVVLLTSIGGWLGIKALGNYRQWEGPILGRQTFHIVLIGTIVNIVFAVLLGLFIRFVILC